MENVTNSSLFDISQFPFQRVFEGTKYPWEAVAQLKGIVEQLFEERSVSRNYDPRKDIYIGENVEIQQGAVILGPAIIGDNSTIGHASFLRENVVIGNNVHIGHGTELKHSVILNRTAVAHLNYIGDSVVGSQVNVSGGAMLANFRLDKKQIFITIDDQTIDTHLLKFGSAIGDGSNIGVNSVLNPGTILGKNTIVYPLINVKGVHKNGEVIK